MAAQDLMVVFSNPAEGRDDEFNRWYDETHLPEVLEIEGVVAARRYELGVEDPDAPHRYLAVYELDQPCAEVLERLVAAGQRRRADDVRRARRLHRVDRASGEPASPSFGRRSQP